MRTAPGALTDCPGRLCDVHITEVTGERVRRGRWLAQVLLGVALLGWSVGRSGFLFSHDYGASAPAGARAVCGVAAVGVLACTVFLTALRRVPRRWTGALLAVQAALTFGCYPVVGAAWGPCAGAAAACVLFAVRRAVSWPVALLMVGADLVCSAAFTAGGAQVWSLAGRLVIDINVALSLFGLMTLVDLARRARAERSALMALVLARERLSNAERLRTELGAELTAVAELCAYGPADDGARERLSRVAEHARAAARTARAVVDTRRGTLPVPYPADGSAERRAAVTARLARGFSVVLTVDCALVSLVNFQFYGLPGSGGWPLVVTLLAASSALQYHHGTPRTDGGEPRWWRVTLPVHLGILGVAVALTGIQLSGPFVLAAGAALYRYRPVPGLAVAAAVLVELCLVLPPGAMAGDAAYFAAALVMGASQVYAYCRLPEAERELARTRDSSARLAVVRERLRAARDIHDLLGFSISGIGLRAELIIRLLDTDPGRAHQEVRSLRLLAERGLAEVEAANSGTAELGLAAELGAARALLEASAVTPEVSVPDPATLPGLVDTGSPLATVLREAVTNVLRHARAGTCWISLTEQDGTVRLRVANDGVDGAGRAGRGAGTDEGRPGAGTGAGAGAGRPEDGRTGTGLAGLRERLAEAGGTLRAGTEADGERFVVTAELPLGHARRGRVRRGRLHPPRLGGDPDRVDPAPGVELGHR